MLFMKGDSYEGGAAKFHPMTDYWGFSSTGHFWDHNRTINDYIAQNVSVLGMNHSGLYTRARLSPLSFTYYGRCLADGNYTVKIHFAEIIIRGNKSFHSLGKQIFNGYIQGKLESEDFDIVPAAQGVEKVVVKEFKAVVKNKTLEVRFHWAGKGTTAIPSRELMVLSYQLFLWNLVLMHDFIIRYNVMAPMLGLVSYLPILETYFINNLASVRSLQLELKSCIEEFEKLDKFHMEQMEEEVTARNAHIHQQKVGSLECFMVAKSSAEEFSKLILLKMYYLISLGKSFFVSKSKTCLIMYVH
ncbi:putative LRR receptor-like serine/threonine-protein kinase [Vitis vinifera]|uniref:Putative LRR receptor-like serine/threonine-protein kinase n=1 Tax=Vitis vinifera TaxID=29760 RepID=A0A438C8J4_VITVI|nr:putative LRR receptor-like serine/threonine-protein kinase [Vitis vinifera]